MLLHTLPVVAIVAEAMTKLRSRRAGAAWTGSASACSATITALGGGSVRDVLFGHHPLSWVSHPEYLMITAGAALMTIAVARIMHRLRSVFLVLDAIGLVVFTVIGCNVALDLGLPTVDVIVSGMITGCSLAASCATSCAMTCRCSSAASLYAHVSVVAGGLYVGKLTAGLPHDLVTAGAMAAGLVLRLLAIVRGWNMPKFVYAEDLCIEQNPWGSAQRMDQVRVRLSPLSARRKQRTTALFSCLGGSSCSLW